MKPEEINQIIRRMDVIINLMMKEVKVDADKIKLLSDMGLATKEIADITGKSAENVGVVLRRLKKKK